MASLFKTCSVSGARTLAGASRPLFRAAPSPAFKVSPVQQRVAAFHASKSMQILPPGPQVIKGSVNDAAPIKDPNPTHGSFHWDFERLIAIGLVPLTVAPFVGGSFNPVMDAVLGSAILIHSYIGFQACVIDYFPTWQYAKLRKAAEWALKGVTGLVLYGLYEYETSDVGITEGLKRVWKA